MESIAFSALSRDQTRAEFRRYTDLELYRSGRTLRRLVEHSFDPPNPAFALKLEEVIAEWIERRHNRRAGRGVCLCHVPGDQPITATAQTWRGTIAKTYAGRYPRPGKD